MFSPDPGSKRSRIFISIKEYKYVNPKIFKAPGNMKPNPDLVFLHIPDPGSRCKKGNGSRIRIRNTGKKPTNLSNTLVGHVGLVEENLAKMLPVREDLRLSGQICSARIN
jgi:hypothetical protein